MFAIDGHYLLAVGMVNRIEQREELGAGFLDFVTPLERRGVSAHDGSHGGIFGKKRALGLGITHVGQIREGVHQFLQRLLFHKFFHFHLCLLVAVASRKQKGRCDS